METMENVKLDEPVINLDKNPEILRIISRVIDQQCNGCYLNADAYVEVILQGKPVRVQSIGPGEIYITPAECPTGYYKDSMGRYNDVFQHLRKNGNSSAVYSVDEMIALLVSGNYSFR